MVCKKVVNQILIFFFARSPFDFFATTVPQKPELQRFTLATPSDVWRSAFPFSVFSIYIASVEGYPRTHSPRHGRHPDRCMSCGAPFEFAESTSTVVG